jgi:hypothetical protein
LGIVNGLAPDRRAPCRAAFFPARIFGDLAAAQKLASVPHALSVEFLLQVDVFMVMLLRELVGRTEAMNLLGVAEIEAESFPELALIEFGGRLCEGGVRHGARPCIGLLRQPLRAVGRS